MTLEKTTDPDLINILFELFEALGSKHLPEIYEMSEETTHGRELTKIPMYFNKTLAKKVLKIISKYPKYRDKFREGVREVDNYLSS